MTEDMISAPAYRRAFESHDSQQHAGELAGWQQNYDQISRGRFRSRLVEVECAGMQAFSEDLSQAVFQTGQCQDDSVAFAVFSSLSGEALWHGNRVGLNDVLLTDGHGELMLTTPKTCRILGLSLPKPLLETWGGDLVESVSERARRFYTVPLHHPQVAARLRAQLERLCRDFPDWAEGGIPPSATAQLRDELSELILDLLCGQPQTLSRRVAERAKKVVRRARDFALERRDSPPSMQEVCKHTFVSLRTLQNCFLTVLGESPATYLKMLRLNGARRDLRSGGSEARVGDVAAQWGFWHLSQFSTDYRGMFGELPSATLNQRPSA